MKFALVLLTLSALALTSCQFLASPAGKQVVYSLAEIGLKKMVDTGHLEKGDSLKLAQGVAILTDGETGLTKAVKLASLGLQTAVDKGLVAEGDSILIQEAAAVVTKAFAPLPAGLPPVEIAVGK